MSLASRALEAVAAVAAAPLFIPLPSSAPRAADEALAGNDADFMARAARAGLAEAALAELALERAEREDVREFARRMATEHATANAELLALAEAKGCPLLSGLDDESRAVRARLAALPEAAFDAAYVNHTAQEHRRTVAAFQRQAEGGRDPDLTAFAIRLLPVMREHLAHAEALLARHHQPPRHGQT